MISTKAKAKHRIDCQKILDLSIKLGSTSAAARKLGIPIATANTRIMAARHMGLKPKTKPPKTGTAPVRALGTEKADLYRAQCQAVVDGYAFHHSIPKAAAELGISPGTATNRLHAAKRMGLKAKDIPLPEPKKQVNLHAEIPKLIRKTAMSPESLAERFKVSVEEIVATVRSLQDQGISIHQMSGRFQVVPPPTGHGREWEYGSRKDGTYFFGVVADTHLCSKHERLDVLNDLYDKFAAAGVDRVFHCGNYIDGEARFNKHELLVHGMDAQLQYLAKHYPKRKGITTFAISGDDHEGWYAQREGVNIGKYTENVMRDNGREDWVDIGYMNAYVQMIHAKTGVKAMLEVCHPGGGSAYADSYAVQKVIEALEGGEKPAIWLGGHYHKMISVEYRNVWCFLCGCTKDLDTFGKKKKLRYVIGGAICEAEQDRDTGAITSFTPKQFRYFNKGYYNDRWSHHGDVVLPARAA